MQLEGVQAPFELVLEGADKIAKQIDGLAHKAESLERLKIGGKGIDFDTSGLDKSLSHVEKRVDKTLKLFDRLQAPRSMRGTDKGRGLDAVFGAAADDAAAKATDIKAALSEVQDAMAAIRSAGAKRVFPEKEATRFQKEIKAISSEVYRMGMRAEEQFGRVIKAMKKVSAEQASRNMMDPSTKVTGEDAQFEDILAQMRSVGERGASAISAEFSTAMKDIKARMQSLADQPISFKDVGEAIVSDINKSFGTINREFRGVMQSMSNTVSQLDLSEKLAAEIMSPDVANSVALLQEKLNRLGVREESIATINEQLGDPDVSGNERDNLHKKLKAELAGIDQEMRKVAEANNNLSNTFFQKQKALLDNLKAGANALGHDYQGNAAAIQNIADQTTKFKQAMGDSLAKMELGTDVLGNQQKINSNIVSIIRAGGEAEAKLVAESLNAVGAFQKTMEYADRLGRAEKEIAATRGDSNATLKTSISLLREQANALKQASLIGVDGEALVAFDKMMKVEKELGSNTATMKLRETIAGIASEINSGAVPSMTRLNKAIATFEVTSGKSFNEQRAESAMLGQSLDKLVANYNKVEKAATKSSVAEQRAALDAIQQLSQKVAATRAGEESSTKLNQQLKMVEAARDELAVVERQVQFEDELLAKFTKVQAMQVAGVNVAKNYAKMQELYVQAKKEESTLEEVIASQVRNKANVVKKLAHEVKGMQQVAGDMELLPDMQIAQLKGALETLEMMRTLVGQMESRGSKMAVIGGEEYNLQAVEKQIKAVQEELSARQRVAEEAERGKRVDEAINGVLKKRETLNNQLVDTLKESHAAVEMQAAGYDTYLKAVDAAINAVQKQAGITDDQLQLEKLRSAAVKELYTEYSRLEGGNFEFKGPMEANKSLQRQRELLKKIADIIDRDHTFQLDTGKGEIGLTTIRNHLGAVENKLKQVETIWRDSSKSFMKYDSAPLLKLEQKVESVKEGMSGMTGAIKLSGDTGEKSFASLMNGILKAENPLKSYQSALSTLHKEQMSNAAATDKQRIATLSELAAVQRQTAAVSGLKKALQGVDDKMRTSGLSLTQALDNPQAAMENMAADPKKLAAMEQAFQKLSMVTTEMTAAQTSKSSIFGALAGEVNEFRGALDAVHDKIRGVSKDVHKIDLTKMKITPDEASTARAAEEQKLLSTIKEQYAALHKGVDVLQNWESIRKNVNEAARRGLDLGKENIAVLVSQDKVYDRMIEHAKMLYKTAADDSTAPIEARSAALLESEKIMRRVKQAMEDMGSMNVKGMGFDVMLSDVKELKQTLGHVPDSLRKAYREAEVFHASLEKSVASIEEMNAEGGQVYDKLGTDISRIVGSLGDWEKAQKKIYRNADFITEASDQDITNKRNQIREAERLAGIMRKIVKLSDDITNKSATVGVDASKLGTTGGAAQLADATKGEQNAKMYVDIVKSNKEMMGLITSMQQALGKSKEMQKVFAGYDDHLAKAKKEVDKVDGALSAYAEKKQRQASRSAGSNMFDIFRMSWFVQLRAFWGMYMGITEVMQAVMEYTHTLNVMQAVTQSSAKSMGEMEESFQNLSRAVPIAMTKTAEAALQVAKAGMSAEETIQIINAAAALAHTTKSDLTTVADVITVAIRSWGMAATQSDQIADLMFNAISKSRASMEGLQQAMGYLSGIAPQANVSLQDTLGLVGVLTNAGLSMSKAATYSRQVLNDLMNPSAKLTAILGSLGIKLSEVDPRFNSLATIFKKLHDAGMDVSQAFEGMSVRGANAFSIALSNADMLKEFTSSLDDSGALMREYGHTTDDLSSKLQLLMNSFVGAANALKEFAGPFLMGLASGLADFVNSITDVIEAVTGLSDGGVGNKFERMGEMIGKAIIPIATLITMLRFSVFAKIAGGVSALAGSFKGMTTAIVGASTAGGVLRAVLMAISAHPIIAIVTALAAAGVAIYTFASDGANDVDKLTESVDQLRESVKKISAIKVDVARSESMGSGVATLDQKYNYGGGSLETEGARENARSYFQSVLSKMMQDGSEEVKKLGRELMEGMFDPKGSEEDAAKWIKDALARMRAALNEGHSAQIEAMSKEMKYGIESVTLAAESSVGAIDEMIGKLREARETVSGKDDFFQSFASMKLKWFGGDPVNDASKKAGEVMAAINDAVKTTPVSVESVPALTTFLRKAYDVHEELKKIKAQGDADNVTFGKDFNLILIESLRLLERVEEQRKRAIKAGTFEKRVTESTEKANAPSEVSAKMQDSANMQAIKKRIESAEAAAGGLKYAVQLAFVAPTQQNVQAIKSRMQSTAEDVRVIMERVASAGKSLFSIDASSAKAILDTLNNQWGAQLELLKLTDQDGKLMFDELMGSARRLAKSMRFEQAGISFQSLVKKWGVGKEVLKTMKSEAKNVPLQSFDELQAKIELVADTWGKMKASPKMFDPKDIASVGQIVQKLTKKQFAYIKAVTKSRSELRKNISTNMTMKQALHEVLSAYDGYEDVDDMMKAPVNMAQMLDDNFIKMQQSLAQNKNALQDITEETNVVNSELARLGEITGQNVGAAMDTEKAYSTLAKSAQSKFAKMGSQIEATIRRISQLTDEIKALNNEMLEDQFDYQQRRQEVIQSTKGPNTGFKFEQEQLQQRQIFVQQQAAHGRLQGPELEEAIKGVRDDLLAFAAKYQYQGAGKDAMAKSQKMNELLVKMQQQRQKVQQLELQMNQARLTLERAAYTQMNTLLTNIFNVLQALTSSIKVASGEAPTPKGIKGEASPAAKQAAIDSKTMAESAQRTAEAEKKLDELNAQLKDARDAAGDTAEAAKELADTMSIQEQETLSAKEAMDDWVRSLGSAKDIVNSTFSGMMDTIKDGLGSAIKSGLRAAISGEEVDYDAIFTEMYWNLMDSYVDMVMDLASQEMFGEGGFMSALWNGETGAGVSEDGVESMSETATTALEGAADATGPETMFATAVNQFVAAVQQMQGVAIQEQQVVAQEQVQQAQGATQDTLKQSREMAQDATQNAQEQAVVTQHQQAASTQVQAANIQSTKQAGGGANPGAASAGGGFWSGFMGFLGMGFHDGGQVTDGNREKDSTMTSLTKGEFVVQEPMVRKYGVEFFNSLNQGKADQAFQSIPSVQQDDGSGANAATAGMKPPTSEKRSAAGQQGGGQDKRPLKINNMVDPKVVEKYVGSDRGKRAIMNVVSAHPYFQDKS